MSSGSVSPISNPQEWDFVRIGGIPSPGKCDVSEFKRAFEWDVKKGKGVLGGTVTFVGKPPAKGSVKFFLWTDSHFSQWATFRNLLKYDPTKKQAQAVDIYHPSFADIGIHSVVVESIGNIVHEGAQLYSCTVEFIEYNPPPKKSAVSTPSGAKSAPPTNDNGGPIPGLPPLDAETAQDEEMIKRLIPEAQAP